MNDASMRVYNLVLHLSVFFFTSALVWFSFIYYPKIVGDYKAGKVPLRNFVPPAVASASISKFPIETQSYKITQDPKNVSFTVYVGGNALDRYVDNKQMAELALKSALSTSSLCQYKVIFTSSGSLKVPSAFGKATGC